MLKIFGERIRAKIAREAAKDNEHEEFTMSKFDQ